MVSAAGVCACPCIMCTSPPCLVLFGRTQVQIPSNWSGDGPAFEGEISGNLPLNLWSGIQGCVFVRGGLRG